MVGCLFVTTSMYLCREKWEKSVTREELAIFGSKN
jgi:hypothetical protein